MKYALRSMLWLLALVPTFGLALPARNRALRRYRTERTSFGDRHFTFDCKLGPLYRIFFATLLMALGLAAIYGIAAWSSWDFQPPTEKDIPRLMVVVWLGLISLALLRLAYSFAEWRYFLGCTRFGDARLSFDGSTFSFLWLLFSNALLSGLTFGLGGPHAQLRALRYVCTYTRAEGPSDLDALRLDGGAKPRQGEGLVDLLDVAEFG